MEAQMQERPKYIKRGSPADFLYGLYQYAKTRNERRAAKLQKRVSEMEREVTALEQMRALREKKEELERKLDGM